MKLSLYSEILKIENELYGRFKEYPDISLLSGIGGLPIFYFLLFKLTKKKEYLLKTHVVIDQLFEKLNEIKINFSYCTGLSGVAHMLHFMSMHKIARNEEIDDCLNIIDDAITNYTLNNLVSIRDVDFLHGALGPVFYLNERININTGVKSKAMLIFEKMANVILQDVSGTHTSSNSFQKQIKTNQTVNCGMAHGYTSIIVILSKIFKNFPENKLIKKALEESIQLVLNCESKDDNTISVFPIMSNKSKLPIYHSALSWCIGDQSIAYGIYKASQVLEDELLYLKAKNIALRTLRRDTLEKSVYSTAICDASFCHGITGIAYLHKKLYSFTRDRKFLSLYENFTKELILLGGRNIGLTGYRYYLNKEYTENISFLNGLIGVGVFYIDYLLNEQNVSWDGIFLLD